MVNTSNASVGDDGNPELTLSRLLIEQRQRWLRGERILVEELSGGFATAATHGDVLLDLIYQEVLLREQHGERPHVDEYVRRFPYLTDELRVQFELDGAIQELQPLLTSENGEPTHRTDGGGLTATTRCPTDAKHPEVPLIEGYQVLHWVGQGGMAVVFKARHLKLNRPVAIKMLRDRYGATATDVRRFLTEAQAAARLQHPHIVQIYEVGKHQGRPFLAYEYLDGGTLAERINGQPFEPRLAAILAETLARTLHFAHQHGVVHRDLKPGNILLQRISESDPQLPACPTPGRAGDFGKTGGTFNGFQLKIADFGLAKVVEINGDLALHSATKTGDILGTPAYMSPEQARGDTSQLTAATDTYALGAILYELLTGRPPFVGVQPMEVLGQVISDEPVRPSHLVRRVPKDIQTICLKCLEKTPGRRYASAADLADDLARFLADQPIVARRTSAIERSWRWCRRHPVKTILATSTVTMLILVAAVSSVYSMLLGHQLTLTSNARTEERTAKVQALHQLWDSHLSRAEALRTSGQEGQRYDGLRAIDAARGLGKSIQFTSGQTDRMRDATIASLAQPDMRILAEWPANLPQFVDSLTTDAQQTIYAYRSEQDEIIIRRIGDGVEVARISGSAPGSRPMLSPDGNKLAILNDSCRILRLNAPTPELIFETARTGPWEFFPDGQRILGTDGDGNLVLVDLQDARVIKTYGPHLAVREIAVSPDSLRAAVLTTDSVQVIDLDTGRIRLQVDPPKGPERANHFAWHPNSQVVAIGIYSGDGVVLWDVESGTRLTSFFHEAGHLGFCFGSTGELLLTHDTWNGRMLVWNVSSGEIELSKMNFTATGISPDSTGGFRMLQYREDSRLATVAIDHPQIYHTLPLIHASSPVPSSFDLSYSADGRLLAVAIGGDVQVFDAAKLLPLNHLPMGAGHIRFDRDASLLTLNELGLNRWRSKERDGEHMSSNGPETQNMTLGPPERIGDGRADCVFDVSRDGKHIAVPDGDGAVVWSVDSPDRQRPIGPHRDVRSLSISHDGRQLVTGGWEGGKACIWDIASGTLIHSIDEPNCCMVQFSPNGKWLVTNSTDVTIWHADTWTKMAKLDLRGHAVGGVRVCFSADSSMLAVPDSTARIHLFNPVDGSEIATLTDPNRHIVSRMAFNPNGNQLAVLSGEAGGVVHIWDLLAIREELGQRDLIWLSDESTKPQTVSDSRHIGSLRFVADMRFSQLESREQLRRARSAADKYDLGSARAAIARAIELQPQDAPSCNNLSWLLTTGPLPLRDSATAVVLARRAMLDESLTVEQKSLYLNTLGVALFRAGEISEAIETLKRSLANQAPEAQLFDLFFLSMCHARQGDQETARDCFNKAEALVQEHGARIPQAWRTELTQFAAEARSMLDPLPRNRADSQ